MWEPWEQFPSSRQSQEQPQLVRSRCLICLAPSDPDPSVPQRQPCQHSAICDNCSSCFSNPDVILRLMWTSIEHQHVAIGEASYLKTLTRLTAYSSACLTSPNAGRSRSCSICSTIPTPPICLNGSQVCCNDQRDLRPPCHSMLRDVMLHATALNHSAGSGPAVSTLSIAYQVSIDPPLYHSGIFRDMCTALCYGAEPVHLRSQPLPALALNLRHEPPAAHRAACQGCQTLMLSVTCTRPHMQKQSCGWPEEQYEQQIST